MTLFSEVGCRWFERSRARNPQNIALALEIASIPGSVSELLVLPVCTCCLPKSFSVDTGGSELYVPKTLPQPLRTRWYRFPSQNYNYFRAVECQADCIVIWARNTDIIVLLLGHFSNMNCPYVWMKAGTSKKQRFIPVHTIYERLTKPIVDVLIPFHALTRSDTTLFFAGHSKKRNWKFLNNIATYSLVQYL